jgi:hypothetical protein
MSVLSGILSSLSSKVSFSIMNEMTKEIAVPNLKIKSVKIRYRSTNINHRTESGSYYVDSRIITPASMEIDAICPDIETESKLLKLLPDESNFYLITSKGIVMETMMVDRLSFDRSSKMISATPVKITFKQQLVSLFDPVSSSQPAQPADSSVIDAGFSILRSASGSVSSLYSSVSSYASSAASAIGKVF